MGIIRSTAAGAAGAAAVLVAAVAFGGAQETPAAQPQADPASGGFPDLVSGIKQTPGCVGVETARTGSGKNVIFAWFEDKKACQRWYYSEMHQNVKDMFFPEHDEVAAEASHRPMEGVPDDVPILTIASITMLDKPEFEESRLPVSQMAIELYTPVTGGLFLGGRFAPDELKVADMHDYTPAP